MLIDQVKMAGRLPKAWVRQLVRNTNLERYSIKRCIFFASSRNGANANEVKGNFNDKNTSNTSQAESSLDHDQLKELIAEKEKTVKEKQDALTDLKDKYMRALAENENLLARNKKIVEDTKLYAIQSFAKDLLEVADVLEKAIESVPEKEMQENQHLKTLFEGLTMTETQLQKVFKSHGLEKINPIDEKFDPNFHGALFMASVPGKEPGTVAVVNKIGYKLHGRPLRAAMVGVVKE